MARKGPLADLSGLQLVAGALAAMTSAWLASWLGVAGTLIGAAVGSVVAGIATTFYSTSLRRGIERSKTLLVTEQGSVVQRADDQSPSTVVETVDEQESAPAWRERLAAVNWKRVAVVSAVTLLTAVLLIGAYERISGTSYGNASNSRIVPGGARQPTGPAESNPVPGPTTAPVTEPAGDPTQSTAPTPTATPSSEPTTEAPPPTTEPVEPRESSPTP